MKNIKRMFRTITTNASETIRLDPPMTFDSPMEVQVIVDDAGFSLNLEKNHLGQLMITKFVTSSRNHTKKEFSVIAVYEAEVNKDNK